MSRVSDNRKIFGTDGVRGVANVEPVTAETALKLGRAAAHVFLKVNPRAHPVGTRPKIVLGKDTRLSGYMLENALVAGITSLGVDVLVIGPLPTPGVAYITRSLRADVANGAAHKPTPCILRELGADITVAHNTPNGTNINAECGSTHSEEIQRVVKESGAHVGITHDGDADRALLCDENGELVDGDEILAIASVDLLRAKKLRDSTLVATVMSNFGLDETLGAHGGKVIRTKVGDRYVLEEMMARNLNVGGEQSGHMIFRDFTTTGDGIISALQVLRIMKESGKPLSELKRCLKKYPQAQRNLRVKRKPPLEELPAVMKLVGETEQQLSGRGRVLLRYSGTESKIRLLIEGREPDEIDRQANRIAEAIEEAIVAK